MRKINDEYDISAAFSAIEDELIASMIRNMKKHKVKEVKERKQWSMWQAEQLKSLEKYRKANQKKFGKQFASLNGQIDTLIRAARDEGKMSQEISILNAIKKGFPAKKISPEATAEFFKLNERKLESLIQATQHDMQKAEIAVLRMADDQYRKVIYNAQVYANSGAGTYEQAVDMATKDMLSAGLNCVEYKNGARHTLADYADMAIRTASKRAYLQGEGSKRQEWGISTVIMNKRGNQCPKCLPWVGKVLIDDVWSGGLRKDGPYPLMSTAIAAGLYHPRCRDSHTTYFEGISTLPDDKYARKELADIEKGVRQEAKQQYADRQAEKFSRMSRFSLDKNNQKQYQKKSDMWRRYKASYEEHKIAWPPKGTKISKDEYKELMRYGAECGIDLTGFKQFDGDINLIKEIINDANEIAGDFPAVKTGRKHLTIELDEYMAPEDFAITNGHKIRLNASAFRSREALESEYKKLVEEGWFVKDTDYHSIIKHEMGHVVSNLYGIDGMKIAKSITGIESNTALMEFLKTNLSEYSTSYEDGSEIISECFSSAYGSSGKNEIGLKFVNECVKIIKREG